MTSTATETTAIPAGTLTLIDVYGLPGDHVKALTYRADRELHVGEQVQVPAPAWSIPVTGRESLPGFVLGESTEDFLPDKVRTILPVPEAVSRVPSAVQGLLTAWAEEARAREGHAAELIVLAQGEQEKADRIYIRIAQVTRALDLH